MSNFFRTALQRIHAWSDRLLRPRWARWLLLALALPTVLLIRFAGYGLWLLNRNVPVTHAHPAEHVKYGSTRGEMEPGLPYWIAPVLPRLCGRPLPYPSPRLASPRLVSVEGQDVPFRRFQANQQDVA